MAVDEALLCHSARPVLRLYGWDPPAISLGHFQRRDKGVKRLAASGLPVVRRITGGGAIVHWHELTYAVVLHHEHPLIANLSTLRSYDAIHDPIILALRDLGIDARARFELRSRAPRRKKDEVLCFHRSSPFDVVVGGRKLLGSAQRRRHGRVLQHGSIILAPNPLQPETASVEAALGRPVPPEELAAALIRWFAGALDGLEVTGLTPVEREAADALVSENRYTAMG